MDFQSLLSGMKEYFNPGSSAIYTEPGQSFGPAVSRLTRVPIRFNAGGPNNYSGLFTNHGVNGLQDPQIDIYPNSQDMKENFKNDPRLAVRHEIAHSILSPDPQGEGLMAQASKGNPRFDSIVQKLSSTRGGQMPLEAPAYMSEGQPERYGISEAARAQYINNMLNQLQQNYPDKADKYRRLIGNH